MSWNSFEMESSIRSAASQDQVWDVLREVKRWPDWAEVCTWSEVGDAFQWAPGQRLKFRLRMLRVPVPFDVTVTEVEQNRRVTWESTEFSITATRTISVEPDSAGVKIGDHKTFRSPMLPIGLAYPRPLIRRMTESWLRDLATEAERRGSG